MVPPLVGVAVKVTEVPVQIEVAVELMLTVGATVPFTDIVNPLEVAVVVLKHPAFEVSTQLTICPLVNAVVVKVELLVPAFVPSTNH